METLRKPAVRVSGSGLKVLAVVLMTVDHAAAVLMPGDGVAALALRILGRMAFPLFAFLLVEGYLHTRSLLRYACAMAVTALLSEVPYDLAFSGTPWNPASQGIMSELLFALLALAAEDRIPRRGPALLVVAALAVTAEALHFSYGAGGIALTFMLRHMKDSLAGRALLTACLLPQGAAAAIAVLPMAAYDGTRGFIRSRTVQYLFYAYYPLHLAALWALARWSI